jgi:hypothetical protein
LPEYNLKRRENIPGHQDNDYSRCTFQVYILYKKKAPNQSRQSKIKIWYYMQYIRRWAMELYALGEYISLFCFLLQGTCSEINYRNCSNFTPLSYALTCRPGTKIIFLHIRACMLILVFKVCFRIVIGHLFGTIVVLKFIWLWKISAGIIFNLNWCFLHFCDIEERTQFHSQINIICYQHLSKPNTNYFLAASFFKSVPISPLYKQNIT